NVPTDISVCVFVLDQCLLVRALQEMLANHEDQYAGVCSEMGKDHEVRQGDIRALKNRQNLFQDEVIPAANEKAHLSFYTLQ
ncbi:hypothetical protein cypCar_00008178, partial [Cyprinus carpio]